MQLRCHTSLAKVKKIMKKGTDLAFQFYSRSVPPFINRPRRIGAFCNLVDVPAHRLQFPDICFCVASVNDKNIPVYRHFTEVCPILLYGKLLHLLVDQPLFFFRNVKLHLYISLSVFHFRTAFRYKGLGLSQQAFSANGYSFAVLAIYSIPPPKGGICCAFL